MREIEFRGKASNGEWIYGGYIQAEAVICTKTVSIKFYVDPKTAGQYTGLKDKNGVKIFEGDVIALNADKSSQCLVKWLIDGWAVIFRGGGYREISFSNEKYEIIGNIHDNPELLNY